MITILDVAKALGAVADDTGAFSADEFTKRSLPFFCGCQDCGALLGPYNGYPSKTGYIRCKDCIENMGYETLEEYLKDNPHPVSQEEYIEGESGICPFCKSDDVGGRSVEVEHKSAFQVVSCSTCGAKWIDNYELTGFNVVESPQQPFKGRITQLPPCP